eukprot:2584678-Rhodomonas_salina.1
MTRGEQRGSTARERAVPSQTCAGRPHQRDPSHFNFGVVVAGRGLWTGNSVRGVIMGMSGH